MKQEIKTIELKGAKSKQLCVLRVTRIDTGTKIFFKSKVLRDLFKGFSGGMKRYDTWGDQRMDGRKISSYDTGMFASDVTFMGMGDTTYISENMTTSLNGWGNDNLLFNVNYGSEKATPNISFIASREADKGVSVVFHQPISSMALNLYVKLTEEYLKFIYENFCGGKEIEMSMKGKLNNKWRKMNKQGEWIFEQVKQNFGFNDYVGDIDYESEHEEAYE